MDSHLIGGIALGLDRFAMLLAWRRKIFVEVIRISQKMCFKAVDPIDKKLQV